MKYKIIEVTNDKNKFEQELNTFESTVSVRFTQTHVSVVSTGTGSWAMVYTAIIYYEEHQQKATATANTYLNVPKLVK